LELIRQTQAELAQEVAGRNISLKIVDVIQAKYVEYEDAIWEILRHWLQVNICSRSFNADAYK
jgi:hypothetical protein